MTGLEPIQVSPGTESQEYIRVLLPQISRLDGVPIFMVDDGTTGTSHDLICEATNAINEGRKVEVTRLFQVLTRLATAKHTVRIWWADNDQGAFRRVKQCLTLEEVISTIRKQAADGTVGLRLLGSSPVIIP